MEEANDNRANTVFLVEDHSSFRQSMARMLELEGFEVVGQAGSLQEARRLLRAGGESRRVGLGVFDLNLPDGEGVELIEEFRRSDPEFSALVLTASLDPSEHARAVDAGAGGVIHKSADLDEIVASMRRLAGGEALVSPEELAAMVLLADRDREAERRVRQSVESLTRRETQVLAGLARGKSNREIAEELHMSVDTERTHMVNILNKLGVHSRLQALVFAARHGIVEIPNP